MTNKHHLFSPSAAHRWLECPASLTFDVEDTSSVYAREGTAAHRLAHQCYLLDGDPRSFLGQQIDGFEVTEEMTDAVQMHLDQIAAHRDRLAGEDKCVSLEAHVRHPDLEQFGGTIDVAIRSSAAFSLIDFKYGAGVAVDAEDNKQLLCYATLLSAYYGNRPEFIEATIVQPRASHSEGPVRTWRIARDTLEEFEQQLTRSINEFLDESKTPKFQAGTHCRWCPAKVQCPELRSEADRLAQQEFNATGMSVEVATDLLAKTKSIETYLADVRKWLHGQMEKGVDVPGYKLVQQLGNRQYCVDEDTIVRRCRSRKFGKRQIYETKLKSPAQLEKVVGKDLVSEFVERPIKGTTVVPEHDKRPAVERQSAADEFSQQGE